MSDSVRGPRAARGASRIEKKHGASRIEKKRGASRIDTPNGASRANPLYFAVWRWHFYAGLYVLPFLVMLAVTGIVMVWFTAIAPEYGERLSVSPGTPLPLAAQAEAAETHALGAVTQYIAPYGDTNPALFRVESEGGARILALDPQSGRVLRDTVEGDTWEEMADHLHGELMLSGAHKFWGDLAVEAAASLCLLLVVTGLYLAWPRNGRGWRAVLLPDFGAKGRAFWKALHLSLGVWTSLVLVLFLISGLSWSGIWGAKFVQAWSTFPAEKWDNVPLSDATHAEMNHTARETVPWALEQTPMPASGSDAGIAGLPHGAPVDFETVAALARQLGFKGRFQLAFPAGESGVWTISRDSQSNDSTDPTSDRTVHVDRFSGRILADVGFADYGLGGKAMAVGIPLHMGLMGVWSAAFNIGFCLLILGLCASGAVMWWKRRPAGAARLGAPPRPDLVPLTRGVVLIAVLMSMAFPVLGAVLLAVLALDLLVIGLVPPLRRALS